LGLGLRLGYVWLLYVTWWAVGKATQMKHSLRMIGRWQGRWNGVFTRSWRLQLGTASGLISGLILLSGLAFAQDSVPDKQPPAAEKPIANKEKLPATIEE